MAALRAEAEVHHVQLSIAAFDPKPTFTRLRPSYLVLALQLETRLVGKEEIPCL